mmetsp:Transcript_22912/g.35239  ORF Transcript_22912/g.35239 Transcript_22912/m.35239 type:complete len:86 (-) Transcript_22912:2230-2487(-)
MSLSSPTHGGKSMLGKKKVPAKSKKTPPSIQQPAVEQWRPPVGINGFAQSEIYRDVGSFNQISEEDPTMRNIHAQRVSHQFLEAS